MSHWVCQFVDSNGERCSNTALHRLHFAEEHPFDHVDVCSKHYKEYPFFYWIQSLYNYPEAT